MAQANRVLGAASLFQGELITPGKACEDRRRQCVECSPDTCPKGAACTNQRIRRHEWQSVQQSGDQLMAVGFIPAESLVVEACGEAFEGSLEFAHKLNETSTPMPPELVFLSLGSDSRVALDTSRAGSLARLMSHSLKPNCELRPWVVDGDLRLGIFASQAVLQGAMLTLDYSRSVEGQGGADSIPSWWCAPRPLREARLAEARRHAPPCCSDTRRPTRLNPSSESVLNPHRGMGPARGRDAWLGPRPPPGMAAGGLSGAGTAFGAARTCAGPVSGQPQGNAISGAIPGVGDWPAETLDHANAQSRVGQRVIVVGGKPKLQARRVGLGAQDERCLQAFVILSSDGGVDPLHEHLRTRLPRPDASSREDGGGGGLDGNEPGEEVRRPGVDADGDAAMENMPPPPNGPGSSRGKRKTRQSPAPTVIDLLEDGGEFGPTPEQLRQVALQAQVAMGRAATSLGGRGAALTRAPHLSQISIARHIAHQHMRTGGGQARIPPGFVRVSAKRAISGDSRDIMAPRPSGLTLLSTARGSWAP